MALVVNSGISFSGNWYGPKLFAQVEIVTGSPKVSWYERTTKSPPALAAL